MLQQAGGVTPVVNVQTEKGTNQEAIADGVGDSGVQWVGGRKGSESAYASSPLPTSREEASAPLVGPFVHTRGHIPVSSCQCECSTQIKQFKLKCVWGGGLDYTDKMC